MMKIRIDHTKQHLPSFRIFVFLTMLFFLANSFDSLLSPMYIKKYLVLDSYVGFYVSARVILMFITCLVCIKLFSNYSKVRIVIGTLAVRIIAMLGMGASTNIYNYAAFDALDIITYTIIVIGFGLFIVDLSTEHDLNAHEGDYYSTANTGLMFGPILCGFIAKEYGWGMGFDMSAVILLFVMLYLFFRCFFTEEGKIHHTKHKSSIKKLFGDTKEFFSNRGRRKAFSMIFGLHIWWSIRIFVILTILNKGFNSEVLGIVLGLTFIPLILNEPRVGKMASKKKFSQLFATGFLICSFMALCLPVFDSFPMMILVIFSLFNLGGSFIEPIGETFLLKNTEPENREKFLSIFNTAKSLGLMVTPAVASLFIALGGYTTMWIVVSMTMIWFAYLATTIKE